MKKQSPRLTAVATEPGLRLTATYTDGRTIAVDLTELVARLKVFGPLGAPAEFATATVADFGWSVDWACGASLDAERLLEMSLEQAGLTENVRFRQWQDAHRLSLTEAANAIGLTRRTVSQYRTGARPVPRTVALACKGWEAEQRADH